MGLRELLVKQEVLDFAKKAGLRCAEIPVRYRKRVGVSKITGTIRGTVLAGHKILWTIFKQYAG